MGHEWGHQALLSPHCVLAQATWRWACLCGTEPRTLRCLVAKLCPTLCDPWTIACQAPLSMRFPRQEYWSGLPFPSPGDFPSPGIEPVSPALQIDALHRNERVNRLDSMLWYPDGIIGVYEVQCH